MRAFLFAALALMIQQSPAQAEDAKPATVVELFTSQGCSSCPPADAIFADLAGHDDVIALAYHVDYWNYLGWRDGFSAPVYSARQKAYAMAAREEGVYTPQLIVNGHARVIGSRGADVTQALSQAQPLPLDMRQQRDGDKITVSLAPLEMLGPQQVQVVQVLPGQTVNIQAGENAGRAIHYANIVGQISAPTPWDPAQPMVLTVIPPREGYAVVLVQDAGHGIMRGALRLE